MPQPLCATVWWTSGLSGVDPALALDERERARWSRYRLAGDRARFLAGRVLARLAVGAELGWAPAEVGLVTRCPVCGGDHGKPRVAGEDALGLSVGLSIAHAQERVVVAVARGCEVGVDVERAGPIDDLVERTAGILDDEERAALDAVAPSQRTFAFLRYWTRKEALLKATGEGLAVPLATVRVTAPGVAPAVLSGPPSLPPERVWMRDLDAGDGYAACLALVLPGAAGEATVVIEQRRVPSDELLAMCDSVTRDGGRALGERRPGESGDDADRARAEKR